MSENTFLRRITWRLYFQILVVVIVSLVLGNLVYDEHAGRFQEKLIAEQEAILAAMVATFSRETGDVQKAMALALADRDVRNFIQSGYRNEIEPETSLAELMQGWGAILQIRWLDARGMEQLRMDSVSDDQPPVLIPAAELQNKADRYYFADGMKAEPGSLYVSPIDLNVERGVVVIPYQPTFRVAMRTGPHNALRDGLLVINYDLSELLVRLRSFSRGQHKIMLVDEEGYWLIHPEKGREWGRDLFQSGNQLQQQNPALWREMQSADFASGLTGREGLVSFQRISVDSDGKRSVGLIVSYPAAAFNKNLAQSLIWGMGVAFIIFLLGTLVVVYDYLGLRRREALAESLAQQKQALEQSNHELDMSVHHLQRVQDELVESRKLSALGMMVAGVAHELNTPVGGALILTSGLESDLIELERSIEAGLTLSTLNHFRESAAVSVDLLQRNLHKAKDVIERFKRLAVDRAREELRAFYLAPVIDDVLISMQPVLNKSGIEIALDLGVEEELKGYPGVMSQIMQNLLMNSVNHAFLQRDNKKIEIIANLSDTQWVELIYQDNGHGVDDDMLGKLFDPFITSARGSGSSGLGLHLVHQWVTGVMQGTIKVENRASGGLRFIIRFPARIIV